MYMCVCVCMCISVAYGDGIDSPSPLNWRYRKLWLAMCALEPNLGPMPEHQMLLTTESSIQTQIFSN